MKLRGGIWAVVPVKEGVNAKTRLLLHAEHRVALARAMLEDVLAQLVRVPSLRGVVLVTVDPFAQRLAQRFHAEILEDGARDGHTGAVTAAARHLAGEGCDAMLTVPGDIPAVHASEIEQVLEHHRPSPSFTIAPAHDGRGSNAVVLSPPTAVPLAFGNDSFAPHLVAARARGIDPVCVEGVPGIARDVDSFDDLLQMLRLPGAPCTRQALAACELLAASRTAAPGMGPTL